MNFSNYQFKMSNLVEFADVIISMVCVIGKVKDILLFLLTDVCVVMCQVHQLTCNKCIMIVKVLNYPGFEEKIQKRFLIS